MKRSTLVRGIFGSALVFILLAQITFLIMMGEKYLDHFKAH
jgi:hypothetical protein